MVSNVRKREASQDQFALLALHLFNRVDQDLFTTKVLGEKPSLHGGTLPMMRGDDHDPMVVPLAGVKVSAYDLFHDIGFEFSFWFIPAATTTCAHHHDGFVGIENRFQALIRQTVCIVL